MNPVKTKLKGKEKQMRVIQFTNSRGNAQANHFVLIDQDNNAEYFQSYSSVIVRKLAGQITLDEKYWDYSVTTSKHRNHYLGDSNEEVKSKIASGEYKLANLN